MRVVGGEVAHRPLRFVLFFVFRVPIFHAHAPIEHPFPTPRLPLTLLPRFPLLGPRHIFLPRPHSHGKPTPLFSSTQPPTKKHLSQSPPPPPQQKKTSTAQTLKGWQAKTSQPVAEANQIKMCCQGIAKLDASLNTLANCEHLSLSTNQIDRMVPLTGMKRLRILSLGRNQLKKIEKLEDVAETLEELWLSYNLIASLDGLAACTNLTTLFMSNNQIKAWAEVDKLAGLPHLRDVLLAGNPIYEGLSKEEARLEVLRRLPHLKKIDGDLVTPFEKEKATANTGSGGGGSGATAAGVSNE